MSIKLQCECGKWLKMPDESAGRRARCPACGSVFVVPMPEPIPVVLEDAAEQVPAPVEYDPLRRMPDHELEFVEDPEIEARRAAARAAAIKRQVRANADPDDLPPSPAPVKTRAASSHGFGPKRKAPPPLVIGSTARPYGYLVLLLALLPLAWATFKPADKVSFEDRYEQSLADHPEALKKIESLPKKPTMEDLLAVLPGDKLDGALLPGDTFIHWGFAVLSAAGFFGIVLLLFPPGHTKVAHLLGVGAFTGTVGIILLLAFQWIAFHVPLMRGGGWVTIVVDLIWLIGQSYRLALEDHGFILSALGFTAGVGFCEEACKALPLVFKVRSPDGFVTWRSAMLWGLISGVGFGVSEGITYSHDFYNGIQGGQIYLIRFISCVALHGIWAAATGINIFRRQDHFSLVMEPLEWVMQVGITVIVPMILHGMYDTLLKEGYDWAALLVALASFGWLAYQIEMAKRRMDHLPQGYAV